jgi:hypothetical protein
MILWSVLGNHGNYLEPGVEESEYKRRWEWREAMYNGLFS